MPGRAGLAFFVLAWALAADTASYVGSKACAGCHAKLYAAYIQTAMGRSAVPASDTRDLLKAAVPVESGAFHFKVERRGDDLFQTESEHDALGRPIFTASYKLEYAIGSGANGITYAVRRGDYLFEAPLSYYSRTREWRLSPGYEKENAGFNRTLQARCVVCHTGRANAIADRDGLYADPPFAELAVGCENCHGPGSRHAKLGSKAAIVNPAKLDPRRADDICMRCHQAGDARVYQPRKSDSDFRPGDRLSDSLAIFKVPLNAAAGSEADLLEHHFSMQLSKCFQESAGRMNCLICHNPHDAPAKPAAAAYYEKKCMACHSGRGCKLPRERRTREAQGCVGCHMPKRDVGFISHSALTNHRIIRRPGEPLPQVAFEQTTPELPDLIYLNRRGGQSPSPLVLLQAYGELASVNPQYQGRYLQLLDATAPSAPDNALLQAALGRRALREPGPDSNRVAIEHLSKALKLGFTGPAAFEDLANALSQTGKIEQAIDTLKRGIELSPYAPRLHKFLAVQYINAKRYEEAKAAMERYLQLFPEDGFVRELLRKAG